MSQGYLAALFLSGFFIMLVPAKGFAAEGGASEQSQSQLEDIKARLENIEKLQQELAAKDQKILEELERLRVWVRRN